MSPLLPPNAKLAFKGVLAEVYQWPQTMYDGSTRTFECYVRPDSAVVIPFLDAETVLVTRQEQPGREQFLDLPSGRVDPGETNEQAMLRELWEETGYQTGSHELWLMNHHTSLVRFDHGIYLAKDLVFDPNHPNEHAGEKIEVIPTKWDDLIQMCYERKLRQWDTMLAILGMHHNPDERERLQAFLNRGK